MILFKSFTFPLLTVHNNKQDSQGGTFVNKVMITKIKIR